MAVRGMDTFIEYFKDHREAFVLIGGAACDLWFAEQELAFRATKDLDVLLVLENLNAEFIARFRAFIENVGYEVKSRRIQRLVQAVGPVLNEELYRQRAPEG